MMDVTIPYVPEKGWLDPKFQYMEWIIYLHHHLAMPRISQGSSL
jgi:hypothetical protein